MILDYDRLLTSAAEYRQAFDSGDPFPFVVLDNFLEVESAEAFLAAFPSLDSGEWIHWTHVNEHKHGQNDRARFPSAIGAVVDELNSDRFVAFLTEVTGFDGVFSDPSLHSGGIHQTSRGGFLNIHADFTAHPHHRDWERRLNLIVYLNQEWRDEYGGHLEFWDVSMTRRVTRIAPVFNRCVIFNTRADSYHGHPDPLMTPPGVTRKSLALYYFSLTRDADVRATTYRPRPGDSMPKRAAMRVDQLALRSYDSLRRRFGFDDRVVSSILKSLARLRKGPGR